MCGWECAGLKLVGTIIFARWRVRMTCHPLPLVGLMYINVAWFPALTILGFVFGGSEAFGHKVLSREDQRLEILQQNPNVSSTLLSVFLISFQGVFFQRRVPYSIALTFYVLFSHFRLSYYPHRVSHFGDLLKEAFSEKCKHSVFGDFKPMGVVADPGFYIHVVEKPFH